MSIEIFTTLVLFLTLIAVSIYTWIAKKQTDELIRQRRLSNLPSLSMDIDFMKLGYNNSTVSKGVLKKWRDGVLTLKFLVRVANFGNGIALNVSTKILCNYFKEGMFFKIDTIDMVKKTIDEKTDPCEIIVEFICEGVFKVPHELDTYMDSIDENKDLEFETVFEFQDIEGSEYQQKNKQNFHRIIHGKVIPKEKIAGIFCRKGIYKKHLDN